MRAKVFYNRFDSLSLLKRKIEPPHSNPHKKKLIFKMSPEIAALAIKTATKPDSSSSPRVNLPAPQTSRKKVIFNEGVISDDYGIALLSVGGDGFVVSNAFSHVLVEGLSNSAIAVELEGTRTIFCFDDHTYKKWLDVKKCYSLGDIRSFKNRKILTTSCDLCSAEDCQRWKAINGLRKLKKHFPSMDLRGLNRAFHER